MKSTAAIGSVPKPKGDEIDPDPDDFRLGGGDVGSIVQLSEKEPVGTPYERAKFPMGFDIRPGVHRKRRGVWKKVRVR